MSSLASRSGIWGTRGKAFTSGLPLWGRGSPMTMRVRMWLAHNDWLPLGSRSGLAAKVSSWCVSVFQARSQCFAYSATKAHWRGLFSSWPFASYEQMTGRLADRVFPRREQAGIPGPVSGEPAGETQFKGLDGSVLSARWKGDFSEGLLGYLILGQRFILGDDGGGTFCPFFEQLLCTNPNVGTFNPHLSFRKEGQLLSPFYREEYWGLENGVICLQCQMASK